MKRIVVASDSFKGSLSSMQVADAVEQGVHEVSPSCKVIKVNVADGGEGTVEALLDTLGGQMQTVIVSDPLGRPISASYGILADGVTAVMEMSAASGLPLLSVEERNPMKTSTYGTGEMINDALSKGCRKFLVGIGGSATNDGGMGMLTALGFRFIDADGKVLNGTGENMSEVQKIDARYVPEPVGDSEFIVACDVDSPFYGPKGAAYVFSPQKGADAAIVEELDRGMRHFADVISRSMNKDIAEIPGAGAAGGLGGGFLAFLNARLERGVEMVLDAIHFDDIIKGADLVITGEGRVDFQTLTGKTPFGVMRRARKQDIRVAAIGGSVALSDNDDVSGFDMILQATPEGMPLSQAMQPKVAMENVSAAAERMIKEYLKA